MTPPDAPRPDAAHPDTAHPDTAHRGTTSAETTPTPSAAPVVAYPGTVVQARIDTRAITHNAATIAARVAPAILLSVVKADAYGHGLAAVVEACRAAGVADFGVATVPEALQLAALLGADPEARRERILCWLYDDRTDLSACARAGIELGVSTTGALHQAIRAAQASGRTVRVHLKIDTGLGRNGFTPEAFTAFLPELTAAAEHRIGGAERARGGIERTPGTAERSVGAVEVVGIMTHLANADVVGDPETAGQLGVLDRARAQLRTVLEAAGGALGDPAALLVHAANSPAALSLDPVPGGLARVGLSTYGLSPFEGRTAAELGLRPAMTLVSRVLAVKEVPAGHGASYGLTYTCAEPTRFALVAGGYADGIPRAASNRAQVSIRGHRYPVVGRIAMDQMILDIGPGPGIVEVGDEVVIIGDGTTGPSAEEWAAWAGTVNYEIVTRIGSRVERVVVGGPVGDGADEDGPEENGRDEVGPEKNGRDEVGPDTIGRDEDGADEGGAHARRSVGTTARTGAADRHRGGGQHA